MKSIRVVKKCVIKKKFYERDLNVFCLFLVNFILKFLKALNERTVYSLSNNCYTNF